NFSDAWFADRAAMLSWSIYRATNDIAGVITGTGAYLDFSDIESNTRILVGGSTDRIKYYFGDDTANTDFEGTGYADHFYGGGGNDIIRGLGGADYIEGNDGDDELEGGFGSDVIHG